MDNQQYANRTIYINYLPLQVNYKQILSIFSQIGPIEDIQLDYKTQFQTTIAIVVYKQGRDARRAFRKLNDLKVGNRCITISIKGKRGCPRCYSIDHQIQDCIDNEISTIQIQIKK